MFKFATIENGACILYTRQKNGICWRKPIMEERAVQISAADFKAAHLSALSRIKIYYERKR